jgi:hypothetical protein
MIGVVQAASLFVRGSESVRLVRITRADGPAHLVVHGPGPEQMTHVLDNAVECLWFQVDLERRLVAHGFQIAQVAGADRRSGRDRRGASRGTDRRRELAQPVN